MIAGFVTVDRAREVAHAVGRGVGWIGYAAVAVIGIKDVLWAGGLLVEPDDEVLRRTADLFGGLASSCSTTDDPRGIARRILLALLLTGCVAVWWGGRQLLKGRRR